MPRTCRRRSSPVPARHHAPSAVAARDVAAAHQHLWFAPMPANGDPGQMSMPEAPRVRPPARRASCRGPARARPGTTVVPPSFPSLSGAGQKNRPPLAHLATAQATVWRANSRAGVPGVPRSAREGRPGGALSPKRLSSAARWALPRSSRGRIRRPVIRWVPRAITSRAYRAGLSPGPSARPGRPESRAAGEAGTAGPRRARRMPTTARARVPCRRR